MKKLILAAAALTLSAAATAQSAQERLDERYNLALAAGYKALFLCSAIANAEANGVTRTEESVHEWELTGVYFAIDPIVRDLDYRVLRGGDGYVAHVEVDWADDMPPRFAEAEWKSGCRLAPIGLEPSMPETMGVAGAIATEEVQPPSAQPWLTEDNINMDRYGAAGLEAIDRATGGAMGNAYGEGRTTAIVIRQWSDTGERDLDLEAYAPGFSANTPQRTWSVAKSIAATLVGVAVHKGLVDVNDRLVRDEWRWDARRQITIDHLLRMASGRYSDTPGNRTDPLYAGGALVEETATDWPLIYKPGTHYRYANNDTLMAVKAVTDRHEDFDPAKFFEAVGMDHTVAETDWAGDYILSSQVWSTAPDLADLGELYLNDGVLRDGTRILPEGWLDYVSAPSGPQPEGRSWGYGAGWWLLDKEEGVPEDTILAAGNRGQYIVVVPSRDVVIVRRGEDMVGTRFDIAAFTRDVLAALEE
ncbi:serine hydrolase [Erythrobacter sp. SCSIO 43205]|uniref:serine hydrolase domain-containing protein n=1 Tax=Erythrobacter sp. SCSIO 43205 TaxID=2779361 RepID=UPI001CA80A91|nr:serine hydrolase [Erythrobacter sp. SCSIO 43205]UAB77456.1 serine hydrolase [Erythrobacter sp. SCSIO 43205]